MSKKPPYLAKFGYAVRQARIDAGLSQESLAHLAGLHRTYIGSIERGERNVSIENILRIAKALDVTCSVLVQELHHSDLENYE